MARKFKKGDTVTLVPGYLPWVLSRRGWAIVLHDPRVIRSYIASHPRVDGQCVFPASKLRLVRKGKERK